MKYHPKKIKPPHGILGLVYCPEYCSEEYVVAYSNGGRWEFQDDDNCDKYFVEWIELSKIEVD